MSIDPLTIHAETPQLVGRSQATALHMSTGDAIRLVSRQEAALEALGWEPHPVRPGVFTRGDETATRRGCLIFRD